MSIDNKCEHTFVVFAGHKQINEKQYREEYVCVVPLGQNNTPYCGQRLYGRKTSDNRIYVGADDKGRKFYYKKPEDK